MPFLRALLVALTMLLVSARAAETPLTRCIDIHALDREVAARGVPVQVHGVVTFAFAGNQGSFVLNDGRGIFVSWSEATAFLGHDAEAFGADRVEKGMLVEIRGITGRGRFAPVIVPQEIRVVGTAELPAYTPTTVSAIRGGDLDCQLIQLTGVVQRSGSVKEGRSPSDLLDVAAPDGHFAAYLRWPDPELLRTAIDQEVRIRGVCFTFFNARGESMGVRVQMSSPEDFEVLRPALSDPFAAPLTTTRKLAQFSLAPANLHRQRLVGIVTLCRPGEFFYLEDEGQAVRVNTSLPDVLRPGQRVEVAGFVETTRYFAEVRQAVFRATGSATPPEPALVTIAQLLTGASRDTLSKDKDFDGRLIRLRGRLLKGEAGGTEDHRLVIDIEGRAVLALLGRAVAADFVNRLVPESEVEVTGIAVLNLGTSWPKMVFDGARDFQLLLRDQADLRVLHAPSWWTPRRLALALGFTLAVLLAALLWARLLRQRVAERSAQLAAEMQARTSEEIEFAATQRERTRLAADLHDTLEQALTGLAFQLDATKRFAPPLGARGSHHFDLSRHLLASSREELRRSIWNLRARVLEGRSFIEALRISAERAAAGRPVTVEVAESGPNGALSEFIAGHLLLLAQEAITNALKHANPERISVQVTHAPDQISLVVEDDGAGFNPASAPGLEEGHFGLQGMRERADRLDGKVEIESAPGRGTRIVVRVPAKLEVDQGE